MLNYRKAISVTGLLNRVMFCYHLPEFRVLGIPVNKYR